MKRKSVLQRFLILCLTVLLTLPLLSVTSFAAENGGEIAVRDAAPFSAKENPEAIRWQDYNGKRLGVLVGPLMEDAAAEFFPDSEYLLFNSYPDCAAALLAGKIDGFLSDEPGMISMHAENPEIDYIHESLTENNYAFAFRKNDPDSDALCAELDEFLAKSWADGTMEEIGEIWLGVDESRKNVDMSGLTGENGTIRVVTTSTDMPWSYIKDGKNVGYDIDNRLRRAYRSLRLCKALCDQGIDVICCIIALHRPLLEWCRENVAQYREIYVRASPETLRRRDQKGLYSSGAPQVVGVDLPWDEPKRPDVVIENEGQETPEAIVRHLAETFGL